MATLLAKAKVFRALHEREGAFVVANAWDAGSARFLEWLGFEALATTSAGFAQTLGRLDGTVSLEEKLAHCRVLAEATEVPLSADLENGFGRRPDEVAAAIRSAARAGVVGASVEDYSGDPDDPIYGRAEALERVQAAVKAARSLDFPFTLTARAENHLHGRHDLDDTIRRLQAFEEAGADVLFAPGLTTLDELRALTGAVTKPVNALALRFTGVGVEELASAGAKRISIGASLARAAMMPVVRAAREMLEAGTFRWTEEAPPGELFDRALAPRRQG